MAVASTTLLSDSLVPSKESPQYSFSPGGSLFYIAAGFAFCFLKGGGYVLLVVFFFLVCMENDVSLCSDEYSFILIAVKAICIKNFFLETGDRELFQVLLDDKIH